MTKLSDGRVFKCPTCGCSTLEEVLKDVTQYSDVMLYEKCCGVWIAAVYENYHYEDGEVLLVQCSGCGTEIDETDIEKHFKEVTDETTTAQ